MKGSKLTNAKRNSLIGFSFTIPWVIGFIFLFLIPLIKTVLYSFSSISIGKSGFELSFVGVRNYRATFSEDPNNLRMVLTSIGNVVVTVIVVVVFSLFLAILLNQDFRGRSLARVIFALPIIIASGVVIELISGMTTGGMSDSSVSESVSGGMFSVQDVMAVLDLPNRVAEYVQKIISNIFDLIWNSGIQTVLFIAGLQSIPSSLYEASRVEGATKWEEFWFITFPMLSNVTLLVMVYTMVELFISNRNVLILKVYDLMRAAVYDQTSAMMWFYFLIVGGIMGIIVGIYRKCLQNKWS